MADIQKCTGEKGGLICDKRNYCYRFTSLESGTNQLWISTAPFVQKLDGQSCDLYWGNSDYVNYNLNSEIDD